MFAIFFHEAITISFFSFGGCSFGEIILIDKFTKSLSVKNLDGMCNDGRDDSYWARPVDELNRLTRKDHIYQTRCFRAELGSCNVVHMHLNIHLNVYL